MGRHAKGWHRGRWNPRRQPYFLVNSLNLLYYSFMQLKELTHEKYISYRQNQNLQKQR